MLKRILIFIPVLLSACLEESSEKIDKKAFTKIYDNSEFNSSFYALDMKQTADGGYLILGGKTAIAPGETHVYTPLSIYLLKTDELGNVVNELAVETYRYPVGGLNFIDGRYYFFAMDDALAAYLISTDPNAEASTDVPVIPTLEKPLASSMDLNVTDKGLLLLSYDNTTQESVISRVDVNGAVGVGQRFSSGSPESPIDDLVVNHVIRQGRQFPFFVGQLTPESFYFNGFYDHTLSVVFTPLTIGEDETTGVVNGQQDDAGLSALLPISGTKFALATYNLGFTFFGPGRDLNPTPDTPMSTTDIQLTAFSFPELKDNTSVKVIRAVLKGKNVLIYASNTKSGQIGLYIYDEVTGEFISSKYLGYSNPFEIGAVVQTAEGDIVVSGTTHLAGRLPRLCLIKVPKDEIKD
jgi:hypothetical protein